MKEKIKKQKGFIQIPLLIGIITSVIVASAGTSVVLYKQGKLTSLTANISEVFKKTEEPAIIVSEREIKPQELQVEGEREVIQGSNETEKEIKKLKEIIKRQQAQIDKLLNSSPEIKEIIKEVPVEKIVYKDNPEQTKIIKELNNLINSLQGQIASLENQVASLQLQIRTLASKNQSLQERIQALQSTPTQLSPPTNEFEIVKSKIEQNEIFPLITGYKDSKGNCRCSSGYNKVNCSGCPYVVKNKLKVGETIGMEVSAISSKNSPVIEYKFKVNVDIKPIKDWSNENFAEYTVPNIPYSSFGITVLVRNDYPQRRSVNDQYDDYIQIFYEVEP